MIVDPLDFRKPIPDPEEGIIPKYDEKAVSFSGLLVNRGRDTKPQRYWYEFQAEIPQPVPPASAGPRKKPVKLGPDNAKETLTVRFYMDQEDARLRASSVGQVEVTVEGRGQIVLGVLSLVINDARVVAVRPAPKPARH